MISIQGNSGNYLNLDGKQYSNFSGNNYLGLATHPGMIESAIDSLKNYGINTSASRKTTGTSDIHLHLEKMLSDFKECEESIVFGSGYFGNAMLLQAVRESYSTVFIDSQSHPSIVDSIPKSLTNIIFYDHLDITHLEMLLNKYESEDPLIITDGLFALTGEISPLDKIYTLAKKYQALLIVDDAHGTGILGKNGRGTPEHFNLHNSENIYQTETMSKALGSYGGFISSNAEVIDRIRSNSTLYAGTTALPPPMVSAGIFSLQYMSEHPEIRQNVLNNAQRIRIGVKDIGYDTTFDLTPIIPLFFHDIQNAEKLSGYLNDKGFVVPVIRYPVRTEKYIVRITASAIHTEEQIEELIFTLDKWACEHSTN